MKMKKTVGRFPLILLSFLSLISCSAHRIDTQETAQTEKADRGDYAVNAPGNEKNIDMKIFSKTMLDIPYAGNSNADQTLDITYPSVGEAPYKTIVLFHGGGWATGNKQSEALASVFQATTQGYAVVSVNYRLSDEVRWPKPLHDAKAAIRFIRASAGKYQLDKKNLVVWGLSAGGHIAAMVAATSHQPAFEDLNMGNVSSSSTVQGVVAWYAVTDLSSLTDTAMSAATAMMGFNVRENLEKARDASPIELVTARFPPILLVHGTNDQVVPYQQSVNMQKKVNEVTGKQTAELITIEGASHRDTVLNTNENISKCLDFVDKILYNGTNPYRNTNYINISLRQ
jgi:acetyl esterase/lipase